MSRARWIAIFVVAAACACHAQMRHNTQGQHTAPWSPPGALWPDKLPPSNVPREQIRELRLDGMKIRLETTTLQGVQGRFGGSIGHQGDASEAQDWLCMRGSDADGRWILWLTSSEMGGGRYIDGLQWQRIAADEMPDRRCASLPNGRGVELPLPLRLGVTEGAARKVLGQPTLAWKNALFYLHEHKEIIHSLPYTVESSVRVRLCDGTVKEIDVDRTSSD